MKKIFWSTFLFVSLISSQVFAQSSTFIDTQNFWPTWGNGGDDGKDTVGVPDITGGRVEISNGRLTSVTFDYRAQYNGQPDWGMLTPGNLFINILNNPGDTTWDYVVNTMGYSNATPCNDKDILSAGFYNLYSVSINAQKGINDNAYILSGKDNVGVWAGYDIRDNHPIGITDTYLTNNATFGGSVYYSGWPGKLTPTTGSSKYDFNPRNLEGGGLDLGGKDFIMGWGTTCANDVVYEKVTNPVPEPNTLLLLGSGLLVGIAGIRLTRRPRR